MQEWMVQPTNASAMHAYGRHAKHHMTKSRQVLGEIVGAHPDHVVFTSGGTEANNLALLGSPWGQVLLSTLEHDSVFKAREDHTLIPCDQNGQMDLGALEALLKKASAPTLVSVTWAHNETGIIHPIQEIARLTKNYGAILHVDAVQALGKIPVSFEGIDLMTLSAHKIGGPLGVGALIVRQGVDLNARLHGGGQERFLRAGTENIPAIVGFAHALQAMRPLTEHALWHQRLEEDLKAFSKGHGRASYIYGDSLDRLPNTTCLTMPGVDSATQVMHFDLEGIAVSMGSACSSGRTQISRALKALGPSPHHAHHAIRISSGWATKEEDLLAFGAAWKNFYASQKEESHV
jgi:cysteine desulfurase